MPTTLPVPIEFRLPEGWQPAPPDEVGAPGVAFVALHPRPDSGFTANITIDGEYRPDAATLDELADASVERLREATESVEVTSRRDIGPEGAPGLTQRVTFSAVAGGVRRELVQSHVYLSMLDVGDPRKRAVIRMVLTATAEQHDSVLGDFQEFLRTVGPDTAAGS
ncbi:hypothetical protein OTB20_11390 [Streptomyces sp. H27-H1]|uniref:hypothetical protein n=1 Tax=Streptomyces sp. H27-H1 TaxID=2996461 RepID=UPI00226E55D3|nr:hypothetical protein [Streptomyces sp. H27-H1]MCY0926796.1 hypothetical protein [Streptomyces sp. H27-H1]